MNIYVTTKIRKLKKKILIKGRSGGKGWDKNLSLAIKKNWISHHHIITLFGLLPSFNSMHVKPN